MRVQSRRDQRSAFTIIELLVVIAIIAVLVGLTAAAVMRFAATGPAQATRTNLGKIRTALGNQWKAVRDGASNYTETAFQNRATARAGAGVTMANPKAKVWYIKLKLIQAFPTNFSEALAPDSLTTLAWPAYVQYLASLGITTANAGNVPLEVQQAVCVLMILEKGPKNTGVSADDLGNTCVSRLSLTPVNGTAPGIVDGWRRPILFTRTNNGQDNTPALLSGGNDGLFGVDPNSFAVSNQNQARDNVIVVNP